MPTENHEGPLEHTTESAKITCVDCDDFEIGKSYSGVKQTPGKEEYDKIEIPDNCPVCGGDVEPKESIK